MAYGRFFSVFYTYAARARVYVFLLGVPKPRGEQLPPARLEKSYTRLPE